MKTAGAVLQGGPEITDVRLERAFRLLYRENLAAISAYALRRSISSEDASDVVAEVFLVAWRRLEDVPPGPAARLWLYGVARRVLANQRRAEGRRAELSARLGEDLARLGTEQAFSLPAEDPNVPEGFREAFAALPARYREALQLSVWEELDATSVAEVLSCSPNAARILGHRARKQLAKELYRVGALKDSVESGHERKGRTDRRDSNE